MQKHSVALAGYGIVVVDVAVRIDAHACHGIPAPAQVFVNVGVIFVEAFLYLEDRPAPAN